MIHLVPFSRSFPSSSLASCDSNTPWAFLASSYRSRLPRSSYPDCSCSVMNGTSSPVLSRAPGWQTSWVALPWCLVVTSAAACPSTCHSSRPCSICSCIWCSQDHQAVVTAECPGSWTVLTDPVGVWCLRGCCYGSEDWFGTTSD